MTWRKTRKNSAFNRGDSKYGLAVEHIVGPLLTFGQLQLTAARLMLHGDTLSSLSFRDETLMPLA